MFFFERRCEQLNFQQNNVPQIEIHSEHIQFGYFLTRTGHNHHTVSLSEKWHSN